MMRGKTLGEGSVVSASAFCSHSTGKETLQACFITIKTNMLYGPSVLHYSGAFRCLSAVWLRATFRWHSKRARNASAFTIILVFRCGRKTHWVKKKNSKITTAALMVILVECDPNKRLASQRPSLCERRWKVFMDHCSTCQENGTNLKPSACKYCSWTSI